MSNRPAARGPFRFAGPLLFACAVLSRAAFAASPGAPARSYAPADTGGGPAVGVHVSTLGVGVQAGVRLADPLVVRGLFSYGGVDYQTSSDGIDYDATLDLQSTGVLLDWHPTGGSFHLSAGLFLNGNEVTGTATPRESQEIGDRTYTPEQIGTLRAKVDFPETAWYLGLGFGNPVDAGGRWTVLFDVGVLFCGEPDFSLRADGAYAGRPEFQAELEKERRKIKDDYVDQARYYPVLALGLAYRF